MLTADSDLPSQADYQLERSWGQEYSDNRMNLYAFYLSQNAFSYFSHLGEGVGYV